MSYFAEIRYSEVSVTPKKYFGDFVLLLRLDSLFRAQSAAVARWVSFEPRGDGGGLRLQRCLHRCKKVALQRVSRLVSHARVFLRQVVKFFDRAG